MTTVTRHITQAHLDEWVKGSGISEVIARLNLESLDDPEEIAHHLNWRAYKGSPGWWVSGIDPRTGQPRTFGQFKPNEPLQFPDDDPAKYVTGPKGSPTKAFFVNTGDAAYWQRILDNPTKLVAITEGFKKAASGITAGIPTVALAGVWNGQVDKKRLIPDLELIAAPGRPICLIFDSDILTKPEVQQALIHLGRLLNKAGCIVTVAQLPAQIKGMDDFIVAHGSNEFKKLVGDARAYSSWLKGLEGQFSLIESNNGRENKTRKVPPADIVAHEVAEQYKDQMAYNNEVGQWMRYGADFPGIWSLETDEYVEAIIGSILDGKNITGYGSYSYITNVVKTLRRLLIVRRWDERSPSEILPFINGVMDVSSGELLPHSPGYRLTWHLLATMTPQQGTGAASIPI